MSNRLSSNTSIISITLLSIFFLSMLKIITAQPLTTIPISTPEPEPESLLETLFKWAILIACLFGICFCVIFFKVCCKETGHNV